MSQDSACGPHTELVKTDGVRISRCTCGTIHISLNKNGTTLQVSADYFQEVAQAMGLARTLLRAGEPSNAQVKPAGTFVTIQTATDPRKPTN